MAYFDLGPPLALLGALRYGARYRSARVAVWAKAHPSASLGQMIDVSCKM